MSDTPRTDAESIQGKVWRLERALTAERAKREEAERQQKSLKRAWDIDQSTIDVLMTQRNELRAQVAGLREALQICVDTILRCKPQVRGVLPIQDCEYALDKARAALATAPTGEKG